MILIKRLPFEIMSIDLGRLFFFIQSNKCHPFTNSELTQQFMFIVLEENKNQKKSTASDYYIALDCSIGWSGNRKQTHSKLGVKKMVFPLNTAKRFNKYIEIVVISFN